MAIRISCCSNLSAPPNSTRSSFPSEPTKLPICKWRLVDKEEDRAWRNIPRATIGLASVMIGLKMVSSIQGDMAMAEQTTTFSSTRQYYRVAKWSDKRMCPPWRVNSLESIVPENLPRPNSRRRWDNASTATAIADAPPLNFSGGRFTGDCFSL